MINDQKLKRYLLGELPLYDQRRVEEQFFSDAQAFERLAAIEDDLIDDYVCGDLSRRQREKFEKHFLVSPERRERLALAQALAATVSAKPKPVVANQASTPWWESILQFFTLQGPSIRYAMVAASLGILIFYGTRETLENRDLRQQIDQLESLQQDLQQSTEQENSQARAREQQLQSDIESVRQQNAQQLSLLEPQPFVLKSASTTRGGATQAQLEELQVTQDSYWIKLQLEFDKSTTFTSYRAMLQLYTGSNEIIWSQSRLQAQLLDSANAVVVMLPASIFTQAGEAVQEYKLTLLGANPAEDFFPVTVYAFRMVHK